MDVVGQGLPYGLEPVNPCDAGDTGIEYDGIEFRECSKEFPAKGLN